MRKTEATNANPDLAASQTRQRDDGWQRMKECAERTDRVVKQAGWVEGQRTGDITTLGWQNHYSPKHARCYIQVSYLNHLGETNSDLPLTYYEFFDAFEQKSLAMCSDYDKSNTSMFCTIQSDAGPHFDCSACRKFVKDRMEN